MYETSIEARGENATSSNTSTPNRWGRPTDVFSVLLILGGDIVNKALAQLAGGNITPVTFSFGESQIKRNTSMLLTLKLSLIYRMGFICPLSLTRKCD